MIAVVTASTLIAYSVYATSSETAARLGHDRLGLTIPFVLYGIFRYLYLVHQKRGGGSPSELLVTDRPLLACVALWALAVVICSLYVDPAGVRKARVGPPTVLRRSPQCRADTVPVERCAADQQLATRGAATTSIAAGAATTAAAANAGRRRSRRVGDAASGAGASASQPAASTVDVEQIMREIRARIAQRHGIDLTTQQIQELAARRLEAILDPRTVKPALLEQLRQSGGSAGRHRAGRTAALPTTFEDTRSTSRTAGCCASLRSCSTRS